MPQRESRQAEVIGLCNTVCRQAGIEPAALLTSPLLHVLRPSVRNHELLAKVDTEVDQPFKVGREEVACEPSSLANSLNPSRDILSASALESPSATRST